MNKDKVIALCHKLAREKDVPFNVILTYYFLEDFLHQLAISPYQPHFIVKGGFLVSNMLGIDSRTTSDIDLLLDNRPMDASHIRAYLVDIVKGSSIEYEIGSLKRIRESDPYGGYRFNVICHLENIRQTISLDIATGDPITPSHLNYRYRSMFSDKVYRVFSYNIESILAEKLETIYRRAFFNSRCKDFYDVHILYKLRGGEIDSQILASACLATFTYRGTSFDLADFLNLLDELVNDERLSQYWSNFQRQYDYAKGITFEMVLFSCKKVIELILEIKG